MLKKGVLEMSQIDRYLKTAVAYKASDLHLSSGEPVRLRVDGDLVSLNVPPVDATKLQEILFEILTEPERNRLLSQKNLDKSHVVEGIGNFRVNIFYTMRGIRPLCGRSLLTFPQWPT